MWRARLGSEQLGPQIGSQGQGAAAELPPEENRRMSKRIEIDGRFYRMRRGKPVEIPSEWVGDVTHPQTIRKRPSKQVRKQRLRVEIGGYAVSGHPRNHAPRHAKNAHPTFAEEMANRDRTDG